MAAVSGPQHAGPLTPSHLAGVALGEHLIQEPQEPLAALPSNQQPSFDGVSVPRVLEQTDTLQEHEDPMSHREHSADQISEPLDSAVLKSTSTQNQSQAKLLQPSRVNALRRNGSDVSGVGSESDSLLDLYGYNSGYRSNPGSVHQVEGDGVNGAFYLDDEDPESSRWIHRDKLARIEIQEMQQAGIKTGINSLPGIKRTKDRDRSREHDRTAMTEISNGQRPLDVSQPNFSAEPEEEAHEEPIDFELRHADEVEGDAGQERVLPRSVKQDRGVSNGHHDKEPVSPQKRLARRLSHSKIPVSVTSPIPIRQGFIEGHPPSHRHGSGPWGSLDGDGITHKKVRNRSNSVGSQMLLDDQEEGGISTPTSGPKSASAPKESPPVVKGAVKSVSSLQGPRSVSRDTTSQPKPRSRSGQTRNSLNQRPGTRSGESPSSNPVKRPEGDPPWLATMYKPDPRLPPDQQLIPTVAKRLQQEQWEKEGKVGSVYDRELNPVSIHEVQPPKTTPQETDGLEKNLSEKKEEEVEWPLKSQKSFTSGGESTNNGTEHGGYKVIPNLEPTGSVTQTPVPPPVQSLQVQTPKDEKERKATCGCCVVM